MKKVRNFIILFILGLIFAPGMVHAGSASINVKTSGQATVGSTITATVTVSSGSYMGSWQYMISYDTSKLKLTSGDTSVTGYTQDTKGVKSKSYTLKFKTIANGKATINVGSYIIYDMDEDQMNVTTKNATVKIITQAELEASYSSNAYLKSLSVEGYELSPKFEKDKYEYSVEVPNDVEKINLKASVADDKSSLEGKGEKTITEGNNVFEITVTAQKGNELTYKVNVYRKELDPIKLSYEGKEYTVIRKEEDLKDYSTFISAEIDINGTMVPALKNETINYTLIGLKDSEGKIGMFIYNDGIKGQYQEMSSMSLLIIPIELVESERFENYIKTSVVLDTKKLSGLTEEEIEYNDIKIKAYKLNKNSKQAIIYGLNVETGEKDYYTIDLEENSIQLYRDDLNDFYKDKIDLYKYVIYGLIGFIVLLLLIIVIRKPKKD